MANYKKHLTPDQYEVCRNKGTEPPFSGMYYKTMEEGIYKCVCCGTSLFSSDTKFDSGTGWPSFWLPFKDGNVKEEVDTSYGRSSTKAICGKCGSSRTRIRRRPRPDGLALLHQLFITFTFQGCDR